MTKATTRHSTLKRMLVDYRRATLDGVQVRIRSGRTDRPVEVRDELEHSDANAQGEIEVALLQMRADTLTRIDEALVRLAVGTYGTCAECEHEIGEPRLKALPFADRCQRCQAAREHLQASQQRVRTSGRYQLGSPDGEPSGAWRLAGWAR